MTPEAYLSGEYLAVHPHWHIEDSAWKAHQVLRMLSRNRIHPDTVTEVGSGAGAILAELQRGLDPSCQLKGYDISPQAHRLAASRTNERLNFFLGDYCIAPFREKVDLLLLMDVVEHVEDYVGFLRSVRDRSRHTVMHVPLDLSAQSVLRRTPEKVRDSAGHLHYFTKDLFLAALKAAGYEVLDWNYTGAATELPASSFLMMLARWPRRLLFAFNRDLAARLLGGFSLLVLARPAQNA